MNAFFNIACVAAGGALGAMLRAKFSEKLDGKSAFPLGTFCANMIASLMFGIIVSCESQICAPEWANLFLQTGFCATLSTFSALAWQISHMLRVGKYRLALFYGASTLMASMAIYEIVLRI